MFVELSSRPEHGEMASGRGGGTTKQKKLAGGRPGSITNELINCAILQEQPYSWQKCNICNLLLAKNVILKHHIKIYPAEKPHKCQWCGTKF